MNFYAVILSSTIGIISGIVYGHLFLVPRANARSISGRSTQTFLFLTSTTAIRLLLLAATFFFVLRIPSILFILVVILFLLTFWTVILKNKA